MQVPRLQRHLLREDKFLRPEALGIGEADASDASHGIHGDQVSFIYMCNLLVYS
jgi:hypothetical protein